MNLSGEPWFGQLWREMDDGKFEFASGFVIRLPGTDKLFVMTSAVNVLKITKIDANTEERKFPTSLAIRLGKQGFFLPLDPSEENILIAKDFDGEVAMGNNIALVRIPDDNIAELNEYLRKTASETKFTEEYKAQFEKLVEQEYAKDLGIDGIDVEKTLINRQSQPATLMSREQFNKAVEGEMMQSVTEQGTKLLLSVIAYDDDKENGHPLKESCQVFAQDQEEFMEKVTEVRDDPALAYAGI